LSKAKKYQKNKKKLGKLEKNAETCGDIQVVANAKTELAEKW
jgi:hypothetical protein